jgi:ribosome-associated protein
VSAPIPARPGTPRVGEDLVLPPARGLPRGLVIPAAELQERFSHSSGPGGQSVNTSDSRVELRWDLAGSSAVSVEQRTRLQEALRTRLSGGSIVVTASAQRSQRQNRTAARQRLAELITEALRPITPRRATRPSRGARQRRLDAKHQRSQLKAQRRLPPD